MRSRARRLVVTGAGSGLGRATALRLAAEGARVCPSTSGGRAEETAKAIAAAGGEALALEIDVTDAGACARMVESGARPVRRADDARELGGVRGRRGPTCRPRTGAGSST